MRTKPAGGLYVVRDGRKILLTVLGRSGLVVEIELTPQAASVIRSLLFLWGSSVQAVPSLPAPLPANVEVRLMPPDDLAGRWPSEGQ